MNDWLAPVVLVVLGISVVAFVRVLGRRRARLGSLSRQFNIGIGLAVGVSLIGIGAWLQLMLIEPRDAWLAAMALILTGGIAAYAAWIFAHGVEEEVDRIRDGLESVGAGDREPLEVRGTDEIADLAASVNRMIQQLAARETERDAAEQARRDLVAAISHDLRTPLTSLQLVVQAMQDGVLDGAAHLRYSKEMTLHVQTLSGLVDDLFELSRLAAGDIEWTMRQVHLDELVLETVDAMRTQADAGGIDVSAVVPADLGPAHANPEGVQRVLFNLIQNAIHHTPADGAVTVVAEPNGDGIEVEVADTGDGIAPAEQDRVFEPFYRGDSARTTGGSGLGLAICRAIVEQHGGRIWIVPSDDGTRVRFSLPRG
jgi:signal transduction histidine kinase